MAEYRSQKTKLFPRVPEPEYMGATRRYKMPADDGSARGRVSLSWQLPGQRDRKYFCRSSREISSLGYDLTCAMESQFELYKGA